MTTLRRDMTRCHGVGCPLALQCLRHVAPVDPDSCCSWVASAHEPGEPTCRHLLPVPNGATP